MVVVDLERLEAQVGQVVVVMVALSCLAHLVGRAELLTLAVALAVGMAMSLLTAAPALFFLDTQFH